MTSSPDGYRPHQPPTADDDGRERAHDPAGYDRTAAPGAAASGAPTWEAPTAPPAADPSHGPSGHGATYGAAPQGGSPYGSGPYGSGPYGGAATGNGGAAYAGSPYGAAGYGAAGYGAAGYGAAGYGGAGNGDGHAGQPYGTGPGWSDTPRPTSTRSGTGRTVLIAAAVAVVVGGGVGAGVASAVGGGSSGGSAGLSQSTQAAPAAVLDGSVAAAAKAISPSVVTLSVSAGQSGGTGSGIIIKTDGDTGYVLTNNHVVTLDSQTEASANDISVTLPDGSDTAAEVVGTDPPDDLAVVKVQASGLQAAQFASSAKLQVGQTVVAMGAPLGLSNTVTSGIVSALARPVSTGSGNEGAVFNAVQTDAAINPGNSGGPLVDLNGHVVGVNSAIAGTGDGSSGTQSGNIGIGFAIPSDEAQRIAGELISTGKATHAVLGINVTGASSQQGPTSGSGATVGTVQAGSPAEKAGIQAGDVITKIGDQRVDDSVGAVAATRSFAPGTTVPVTINRGGQSQTVQVTLGSATDS